VLQVKAKTRVCCVWKIIEKLEDAYCSFILYISQVKKANLRRYLKRSSSHETSKRFKIAAFIFPEPI